LVPGEGPARVERRRLERSDDPLDRRLRRGRRLATPAPDAVGHVAVGERAADVDADRVGGHRATIPGGARREQWLRASLASLPSTTLHMAGHTMASGAIEGGCLCGGIRYVARGRPTSSMICHCDTCCRAAGSPVVAWLTFPVSHFSFVRGVPAEFHSTAPVTRTFCPTCGTSLTYVHADRPAEIDVTTSSLDHPEAFPPTHHSWLSDSVSWVRFADGLPAHRRSSAEG
jgi:hypothetical protein